jgi:pyruvate/2-oxoglutarate dehydrogenase complex dihydrolipoamide acyltransferase (E2) component
MGSAKLERVVLIGTVFATLVGFGKKAESPPPAPNKPESASVSAVLGDQSPSPTAPEPSAPTPAPAPAPSTALPSSQSADPPPAPGEPLTGPFAIERNFMTEQLQIFIAQKKRLPKDFNEFAGTRLDGVPAPPKGQRWAIDGINRKIIIVPK